MVGLCPNGFSEGKGNSISAYLVLHKSTLQPNTKLLVDYTVRAKDQISGRHAEEKGDTMFTLQAQHSKGASMEVKSSWITL